MFNRKSGSGSSSDLGCLSIGVDACLVFGVHSGFVDVDGVVDVFTNMCLGVVMTVHVAWSEVVTVVPSVDLVMAVDVI